MSNQVKEKLLEVFRIIYNGFLFRYSPEMAFMISPQEQSATQKYNSCAPKKLLVIKIV